MKYKFIDHLKKLRFKLVPGTKELSLVILGITKLGFGKGRRENTFEKKKECRDVS